MKLDDFKEEIYKCSGCGLCQSVCPVYKVLQKECAVSRGKFKLLNAVVNREIGFSKKILEIMDICLHCQACSAFCPSGIDAQKIIETSQNDMLALGIFNLRKISLSQIFDNKFYMCLIKIGISIVRGLNLLSLAKFLKNNKIKLVADFLKVNIKPLRQKDNRKKNLKVVYFKGCINSYVNPSSYNAAQRVLDKTPVELLEAPFQCCGLPLKSAGDFESFKNIAQKNIDIIYQKDFDYLIFDCASCKSTFLEYSNFLEGEYKEKAVLIAKKSISIYELLKIIDYQPKKKWKNTKVTCHYPCHTRFTADKNVISELVQKIPNTQFIEMKEPDSCCGAAGSFMLLHENLSSKISSNKAKNIIETGADVVVTACPSCFLGLKQGLLSEKADIKVLQLIEFLAQ